MPPSKEFEEKRAEALPYELGAAAMLQRLGWWVLPAYDYSGRGDNKAPRLLAPAGCDDLILPDLLAFNGASTRWVEVKAKGEAVLYRKTKQMTTGFCLRLYHHYRRVQEITGNAVWMLFAHQKEQEVRGGPLDELERIVDHECEPNRVFRHGGIFYRYQHMARRCSLAELLQHVPTTHPASALEQALAPDPEALTKAEQLGLLPYGNVP